MKIPTQDFELIETLRWRRENGYYLLERHLERMMNSASNLGFKCTHQDMLNCLNGATTSFTGETGRVRLLLSRDGSTTLNYTSITLPKASDVMVFAISDKTIDSGDLLYRHKTTRRELFDRERVRLQELTGCDEAIFTNERGELTEGSITSIFIEKDGILKTPPVSCGLLPGTLRAELLSDKKLQTKETILTLADLKSADSIFLGNSVRGLINARQTDKAYGLFNQDIGRQKH